MKTTERERVKNWMFEECLQYLNVYGVEMSKYILDWLCRLTSTLGARLLKVYYCVPEFYSFLDYEHVFV